MTDPEICPGAGQCHNARWCPDCDAGPHGPCHVRAAGGRCDAHPGSALLRPDLEAARHEEAVADLEAGNALASARIAGDAADRALASAKVAVAALDARRAEAAELQAQLTAALADELGGRA